MMKRREFILGVLTAGAVPAAGAGWAAGTARGASSKLQQYEKIGSPEEIEHALSRALDLLTKYDRLGGYRKISEGMKELDRFHRFVGSSPEYCVEVTQQAAERLRA